jgi:metal-dependent amidase/aminoacylase/carboxypeptidase family protein
MGSMVMTIGASARPKNASAKLARATASADGCTAEVDYHRRDPPLISQAEQTDIPAAAAPSLVGGDKVNAEAPLATGSEDFSFMLNAHPRPPFSSAPA